MTSNDLLKPSRRSQSKTPSNSCHRGNFYPPSTRAAPGRAGASKSLTWRGLRSTLKCASLDGRNQNARALIFAAAEETVMLRVGLIVPFATFSVSTVKLYVPAVVGVPDSTPFLVRVSPGGSAPLERTNVAVGSPATDFALKV